MKHLLLSALSLCALLCAQPSFAQTKSPNMHSSSYALDWIATGEISGGAMTSPSYHMSATIGQMGANTRSASAGYKLANGFQSVMADAPKHSIYLPIVCYGGKTPQSCGSAIINP